MATAQRSSVCHDEVHPSLTRRFQEKKIVQSMKVLIATTDSEDENLDIENKWDFMQTV